jgi:hypothetical protein
LGVLIQLRPYTYIMETLHCCLLNPFSHPLHALGEPPCRVNSTLSHVVTLCLTMFHFCSLSTFFSLFQSIRAANPMDESVGIVDGTSI